MKSPLQDAVLLLVANNKKLTMASTSKLTNYCLYILIVYCSVVMSTELQPSQSDQPQLAIEVPDTYNDNEGTQLAVYNGYSAKVFCRMRIGVTI